jgi:pimeloyl-ACP methyl ester carboxylesterase
MIAVDEQIKGTTTRGELSDVAAAAAVIPRTTLPVLVVVGQHDIVLMDEETDRDCFDSVQRCADWSPVNFTFQVVEATGHNLNLHPNAHESYRLIDHWLRSQAVTAPKE